ncbi:MAG TPA: hypothetical protein VMZ27_13925 [Candidatus Saccharimonadales bacterium]|nr:hypothetical protein [Candidatus Saccharimonadales bacterium]
MKTETVENQSRTFQLLFSISQDQLDRDLATPCQIIKRLNREDNSVPGGAVDPSALEAQRLHNFLLLAYALQELDFYPLEKRIFIAGQAAAQVATKAVLAAMDKGRLKDLSQTLDRIKEREGLSGKLGWLQGDGPADYEQTSEEFAELIAKIHDTLIVEVFRRYRLSTALEIFQEKSLRFHKLFYKGQNECQVASGMTAPKTEIDPQESPNGIKIIEQGLRMETLARRRLTRRAALDTSV